MAFYQSDPNMLIHLKSVIKKLESEDRPDFNKNIAISWIRYNSLSPTPGSGFGASWNANKLFYPASLVKLIYAIATEIWIRNKLIVESEELFRALSDMLIHSSNDATSYIIDVLTGTTSGPSLRGECWQSWQLQRKLINQWIENLGWEETKKINCCQKTWTEGPYGRDKDFYGERNNNRNALNTSSIARFFEALMSNQFLTSNSSKRLKKYLYRSLIPLERQANPENQIDGFLGEGLSQSCEIWSKAGWMSQARHDAAWWKESDKYPMLVVIFSKGKALSKDNIFLPSIAKELKNYGQQIT